MNLSEIKTEKTFWKVLLISAALLFLFATVLIKLGRDWWTDENYSHGLLVPFVIGYIIWLEFENLQKTLRKPNPQLGLAIVLFSLSILLVGTLGTELFTQRISFVLMLVGVTIYLFGAAILQKLVVPFALLLLAIPIPQIIFNKIAFPLQMWSSHAAVWGIKLFDIPAVRNGNVIKLVPSGETQTVALEVVEACSGIRSLMTLVTLALILSYFTQDRRRKIADNKLFGFVKDFAFWQTVLLMLSAIPIALLTNAARVTATGVLTYYYGLSMAAGSWHEVSSWLVFVAGFALLVLVNFVLSKFARQNNPQEDLSEINGKGLRANHLNLVTNKGQTIVLLIALLTGGVLINWFEHRGEAPIEHASLHEFPAAFGAWRKWGEDTRFNAETEKVLRASDYVMRNYTLPTGRFANLYIGYYASQRTGATYHSPLNCLPGSGWEMKNQGLIEIRTASGKVLPANRYIVQNGNFSAVLIYWYQGRGRATASEYQDKIYRVFDSILRQRSDGAMVRVLTPIRDDEVESEKAAVDFSSFVADQITPFIPD